MKEDVLEQVVDDYLRSLGFFTQANVRYRPSPKHPEYVAVADSGWSDIDVIGYCPTRYGADKVWVVSCKSWQTGLDPGARLDQLRAGKETKVHREVWSPSWGQALCDTVERLTGQRAFRFFTAVTKLKGQVERWSEWMEEPQVRESLEGNWVGFLRLEDMWRRTVETSTTTLAGSVMGRLAQMMVAADLTQAFTAAPDLPGDLVAPQDVDYLGPSLAAMWLPPPAVATCAGINDYAHTLQGYEYARRHYGVDESPEGLTELMRRPPKDKTLRSFEVLRLEQFLVARGWHHEGMLPEVFGDWEAVADAMTLHGEIQRAWAQRRFDRPDVPSQRHMPPDHSVYFVPDWQFALQDAASTHGKSINAVFEPATGDFIGLIRSDAAGLYVFKQSAWYPLHDEDEAYEGTEWIELTQHGEALAKRLLSLGKLPSRQEMLHADSDDQ